MTLRTSDQFSNPTRLPPRGFPSFRLFGAFAVALVLLISLFAGSSRADVNDYAGTQLFLVGPASSVSGSYQMTTSSGATGSPGSDTRPRVAASCATLNACGYLPFSPSVVASGFSTVVTATPTIPPTCKGWIVDAPGGMTFSGGSWQFAINVKVGVGGASGAASLVVGMWKVDASGAPVSGGTLINPTAGSAAMGIPMIPFAGTTHLFSFATPPSVSSFTLGTSEHLCVQVWRNQTASASSGGNTGNTFSMLANDSNNVVTHPTADGFPVMTLSSPADGSYVNASQTLALSSTYSDPESEAGTVVTQVCQSAGCSPVYSSDPASAVVSGTTVSSSPSLADGTWYWRVSGTDTVGGSSWSPTRSFIVNTTIPTVPTLVSPAAGVTTNSLNLAASFSDPSIADTGTVDFRLCIDPSCSTVVSLGSSSSVTNGSTGTWTITPAPADGTYYWEAANHDLAGNVSAWSGSRMVKFDRTPPTMTIGTSPGSLSTSPNATFGFSASESAIFECNLDSAGWGTSCTSPAAYTGLADGSHSFQVRGTDGLGNVGTAATWAWSIDTTVPSTPTLTAPADAALTNTIPQLGGTFTDPTAGDTGTVQFRICTASAGAGSQCSPLVTSGTSSTVTTGSTASWTASALADGTYTWQARAQDTAGNPSGWSATRSFVYDSTPPNTTITAQPSSATTATSASFSFASTESPSTLECSLDSAPFAPCASPLGYSALTEGSHTFQVRATDAAGNTDPTPASYTWVVDLTAPDTTADAPADGAWVNELELGGIFSDTSVLGTGTVEFRICSDPLCLGTVRTGGSGTVVNGALAKWSPSSVPVDGVYYWQARSRDAAGNLAAWTATRTLHLDRIAPAKPLNFHGEVATDGLTLRWAAPSTDVANYVVFVNGAPWKNFGSTEFEVKVGTFDESDARSFSVVAVDLAGNVGVMSPVLVGVPNLVGLTWAEALGASTARGLSLRHNGALFPSMVVSEQDPTAPTLAARDIPVLVTLATASGARLAVKVEPGGFSCSAGSVLIFRLDLSVSARVRDRLLNGQGRVVKSGQLGLLRAGTNKVRFKLPSALSRGTYRLLLDATAKAGTARAVVRVKIGSGACRAQ